MKILFIVLSTVLLLHQTLAEETKVGDLSCQELNGILLGSLLVGLSKPQKDIPINFHLAEKNNENGTAIGNSNFVTLQSKQFDPSLKTYIISHGYMSHYKKPWITTLKNLLLDSKKGNIILVDWEKGSHRYNYINSVQITEQVAKKTVQLLEDIKKELQRLYKNPNGAWKQLHLIGHSLGAHISGQIGHQLRSKDRFFTIERITALDPAQPCFTQIDPIYKVDKTDADFVDVIHTQTGMGKGISGFGLKEAVGHVDFYINGGVIQPQCEADAAQFWKVELNKMICSHKIATEFFTESLKESAGCKFVGQKWDRTYDGAVKILDKIEQSSSCPECPSMGIDTSKNARGTYLVFTSTKAPVCKIDSDDISKLKAVLQRLTSTEDLFPGFDPTDTGNSFLDNFFLG